MELELDLRTALRTDGRRRSYRFQLQGPTAMQIIEKALGQAPPELKFFHTTDVTIAGNDVGALRHGMVGQPGWELFGPWDDREPVLEAILAAGEEFGLRRSGGRAYSSNTLESGWIPSPLPAVYSGEALKAYREWLPATGYEGSASLGGSFVSADIEDYYFTPWDLGYGQLRQVRPRLHRPGRARADGGRRASPEGHAGARGRGRDRARSGRCSRRPTARSSSTGPPRCTRCTSTTASSWTARPVGVSTWIGYSANEGKMLTLAVLDAEHAEPGTEVTLVWGEEDGGTSKPTVEPHVQTEIGAVVSPVPYVEAVRRSYAPGSWRATRT